MAFFSITTDAQISIGGGSKSHETLNSAVADTGSGAPAAFRSGDVPWPEIM
jgi:hypothetical protein